MKKFLFLVLILVAVNTLNAQKYYTVIAKSGLNIRTEPNLNSQKVGKFEFGENLELIKSSGITFDILDEGKKVVGKWVKMQSEDGTNGYVFSGFLLPAERNPKDVPGCDPDFGTCGIKASNDFFDLEIFDFQGQVYEIKNDTLYVADEMSEISHKLIHIKPNKKYKKVKVSYTYMERMYPFNKIGLIENNTGEEWIGTDSYNEIKYNKGAFFRGPNLNSDKIQKERVKKLNLTKSEYWGHNGEGAWVPTYNFRGTVYAYSIPYTLFKLILTDHSGNETIKYIQISNPSGC
ncbi:SH3 domain-containing protein [Aureivirga sp. CE67]|uniref:SH3 domain-containing protein n=1 Tax=Aureivirga sp. CE67 TaxID=1788983 RepID=UPI0018CADB4A|nr:SH3 domain-containing protein [Aureivirga sp. CE67]